MLSKTLKFSGLLAKCGDKCPRSQQVIHVLFLKCGLNSSDVCFLVKYCAN